MRRSCLSLAAAALVILYLFVGVAHLHLPGFDENCPICDASFTPVYLGLTDLIAEARNAEAQQAPVLLEVNRTLAAVASSLSFRGPPA
jgi:hypothetical protein